jgi:hypothetical protein
MGSPGEKLGGSAAVKGTMLAAHLDWARGRFPSATEALRPHLPPQLLPLVSGTVLAIDWYPLATLVAVDKAIAGAVGGPPDAVFRELGRNSALVNLAGAYKTFIRDEPHRFFEAQARLHDRFLNFGREEYVPGSGPSGEIRLRGYLEYSPVFCRSAGGYYEGALEMMKVPGPIQVKESACQCAGDSTCVFELSWH